MESLLEFVRGPLFRLSFAVMIVGLLRHLFLVIFGMVQVLKRADKSLPPYAMTISQHILTALKWIVPISHIKKRIFYSTTSIVFHIGVILAPIFLWGHVQLWREGIGFGWPALSRFYADMLTGTVIIASVLLFTMRVASRNSRFISRPQDYTLPWILSVPFITGYLAMHPHLNPVPYTTMMTIHVVSAELVFICIPFTKITHCIMYPFAHSASNIAWRFVPEGGEKVFKSLGKEGRV